MGDSRVTRRWVLVGAGTAVLLGAAAVTLPATASADPEDLRTRILAGLPPHVGYAESTGRLGLPEIAALEQVTALFTSVTRLRTRYAGPEAWRVDELTPAGERDTYRLGGREYVWDFGANQLTVVSGETPVRLPRAADLVPSELARRLTSLTRADPVSALPARRVAGFDAAGLRITPADPDTTVGRIDVWCDPASALPLRVEVAARGADQALLFTEFREVSLSTPEITVPTAPPGAGEVTAEAADLAGALRQLDAAPPPPRLAGRDLVPLAGGLPGVGVYGAGVSGFVLVPASRGIADRVIDGAPAAGGTVVDVPVGRAAILTTPLLSVAARGGIRRGGVLVAGTVAPAVLDQALRELPGRRP
ncbi:hypothetical protein [Pseudonocardia oroxyli]|uniref:Outer membrane lipoprotein-sorting protein n=1 Tax=Pseudonocardia oroxyli TaxID=366584 RepID=A0A1G8BSD7_PSEOR|nr:hypothetical protein [Pseudonocardia oroxyli]SDH36008.1 hypothetical protein SAMN05216377_121106 [Pseudonocardia oroxyli]